MITVRVRYWGILSAYTGGQQQTVCVPEETTVEQLFLHLAEIGSETLRSILWQDGKPNPVVRVVRNQSSVKAHEFQKPLSDGDEILIVSSVSGG